MKRFVSILCCLAMILVSIPFSVSATEESIDFSAEILHSEGGLSDNDSIYVLNSKEDCADFIDKECTNGSSVSTNVSDYFEALPEGFFNNKALVAIGLHVPNPGYAVEVRDLTKENGVMTIKLDYWEIDPELAQPTILDYFAVLIEVNKDVLDGVTSFELVRTNLRYITSNVNFINVDNYSEEEPLENAVPVVGDGDLYVLDTAEKAANFAEFDFYESYNQLDISDYIAGLSDDFFESKAILASVVTRGQPDHIFESANVSKVGGTLTIELYHTVIIADAFPAVMVYHIALIEIDKDLLDDVDTYNVEKRDHTDYENIEFDGHIFDGAVKAESSADPIVIEDANQLADFVNDCDSTDFKEYVDGLAEKFFETKVLVVAAYTDNSFTNINYEFGNIVDEINGVGTYWNMYINADQSNRKMGKDCKLFVYEIDKDYKDVTFHLCMKQNNIPKPFCDPDITVNLSAMSYLYLKRNYFNNYYFDEEQLKNADVNKNGVIDPMDYLIVKRIYFGQYAFNKA